MRATPSDDESRAELDALADLLMDARRVYDALVRPEPEETSEARRELEGEHPTDPPRPAVERLIRSVELWLIIASDQLYGLGAILRDGQSVLALFPILRSVIEHSALVAYSLDEVATQRVRAARASLSAIRSAEEMHKAASHMAGSNSDVAKDTKAAAKRLKADVRREFGTLDLTDPRMLEGEREPTPTKTLEHLQERLGQDRQWEGIYDYLCATATHPSLSAFEYLRPDGVHLSLDHLRKLLSAALVAYTRAVAYFASFMGWPIGELDAYRDRINELLVITE